jgi:hypothetical protein
MGSNKKISLETIPRSIIEIQERLGKSWNNGGGEILGTNYREDYEEDDDEELLDEEDKEYLVNSYTDDISFIEFAIINGFLHETFIKKKTKELKVNTYGNVDNIGRLEFGGGFDVTSSFWYSVKLENDENDYIFQTKVYIDNRGDINNQIHMTCKTGLTAQKVVDIVKDLKKLAFNKSEYNGKCVKVKLRDGRFKGIEIIDFGASANELILNPTQRKYVNHFVKRVARGGSARFLFNGEPGTGKTESIREIGRQLTPQVTFVIPDFGTTEDLTSIMEACEIFDNAVIVMDDIDLYLGSRDNGSYTKLLGQFLSFFDGVKKRKISLLASTNDKGLVDKAAERPGRFNFTLDYGFLDEEQIEQVCKIHLQEQWQQPEVYKALSGRINGKKVNITGAFIANLADNIKEMSEDEEEWNLSDTVSLIEESYKGFYHSQVEKEKTSMGFGANLG